MATDAMPIGIAQQSGTPAATANAPPAANMHTKGQPINSAAKRACRHHRRRSRTIWLLLLSQALLLVQLDGPIVLFEDLDSQLHALSFI